MTSNPLNNYEPNESRFLELIESMPKIAVQGYDKDRRVIFWNQASCDVYGFSREEALGKKLEELIIPKPMRQAVVDFHRIWIEEGIPIPASELSLQHKDGHSVMVFSTHVMLKQNSDNPEMFCVDVDLTEQHLAKLELQRIATTDLLTGLPNRRFFEEELSRRINEAGRFKQKLAVLFIDIDLFKEVNDTMGHNAGDRLLMQIANRVKPRLRLYDTLSRFGGDEFVVILPNIHNNSEVECVVNKIMEEFKETFSLFNQSIYTTASIGISLYPKDGKNTDVLLKHSDAAMYQAKEDGRNRYRFFDRTLNDNLHFQRDITSNLRSSLKTEEFHLVYQPQMDLNSGKIVACEALLRWNPEPPISGVTPDIFIPIAERSDLIVQLGEWVLRTACQQVSEWRQMGIPDIRIDINVSGKQLEHNHFFSLLFSTLNEFNLSPKDIGIELTEHALIEANEELLTKLKRLKSSGMEISIDDFGTGYSSLSYLQLFPVNNLKIDRSFVTDAPNNKKDAAILKAIIEVGHTLDLTIVIEGIETKQQADFCRDLGSDLAQGYWYHRPMLAKQILQLLIKPAT